MKGLNKYIAISFGAIVSGYGAQAVITQEIFVEGSRMRGVGWHMYGTPAVFGGALILALGLYVIWLAFTSKE
tara:strand:- start:1645 stop:1860 length:216 start_codon:yes stop_codon:yes gene_type:complete